MLEVLVHRVRLDTTRRFRRPRESRRALSQKRDRAVERIRVRTEVSIAAFTASASNLAGSTPVSRGSRSRGNSGGTSRGG